VFGGYPATRGLIVQRVSGQHRVGRRHRSRTRSASLGCAPLAQASARLGFARLAPSVETSCSAARSCGENGFSARI